jgi:hypothetical protein
VTETGLRSRFRACTAGKSLGTANRDAKLADRIGVGTGSQELALARETSDFGHGILPTSIAAIMPDARPRAGQKRIAVSGLTARTMRPPPEAAYSSSPPKTLPVARFCEVDLATHGEGIMAMVSASHAPRAPDLIAMYIDEQMSKKLQLD